jgi:hypothetical protein
LNQFHVADVEDDKNEGTKGEDHRRLLLHSFKAEIFGIQNRAGHDGTARHHHEEASNASQSLSRYIGSIFLFSFRDIGRDDEVAKFDNDVRARQK